MSNAPGISPAVMINRIALRDGAAASPLLVKVAKLRMDLMTEVANQQARDALLSPDGEAKPIDLSSGAAIDRLI